LFSHLCWIVKDFAFSFGVTYACFFNAVKPFQGFSNDQRSDGSGHPFDLENDFIGAGGIRGCIKHQRRNKQRKKE